MHATRCSCNSVLNTAAMHSMRPYLCPVFAHLHVQCSSCQCPTTAPFYAHHITGQRSYCSSQHPTAPYCCPFHAHHAAGERPIAALCMLSQRCLFHAHHKHMCSKCSLSRFMIRTSSECCIKNMFVLVLFSLLCCISRIWLMHDRQSVCPYIIVSGEYWPVS